MSYDSGVKRARVVVDSHLRLGEDFSVPFHELCMEVMTLDNEKHYKARAANRWDWQNIPKTISLYSIEDDHLVIPRGFALKLKQWLREDWDTRVRWIDRTVWEEGPHFGAEEFEFRNHQLDAAEAFWKHRQGIYKSPTGSGKSGAVAGFLWLHHPKRAIVMVDRINLVDQWIADFKKLCGDKLNIGAIGSGQWSEGQVTIATVQTLHKRREHLKKEGWFNQFSAMFLDESHHATAQMYRELVSLFPARIRIGMSATPDQTGDFAIALNVLGPVFHEDTYDEIREAGFILTPKVKVIHTPYRFNYWGDHTVKANEECDIPNCPKIGTPHSHKNNYGKLRADIVQDLERNRLIASTIMEWHGKHQLVVSSETKHLDEMISATVDQGLAMEDCFKLTGNDARGRRAEIRKMFVEAPQGVLFSTVAGEALNIPEIDCAHLAFPTKNAKATEQKLGRAVRIHEGKPGATIIDYADTLVRVLAKQFKSRRWKCYEPLGLEVEILDFSN